MAASAWPKAATYKIGAVARMLGTSVSTLRHYEREGLLMPLRSAKGTRLYNEAEVARFRIALKLTELGVPLGDVIALTRARPGSPTGDESSRKTLRALDLMRGEVEARRAQLEAVLASMARAADLIAMCADCPRPPTNAGCPDCPCSTRFADSEILALTWSVRE